MQNQIRVMDLERAEQHSPAPGEVCISITSPNVTAELQDGWHAVLRMSFSDIDTLGVHAMRTASASALAGVRIFTDEMARQVVEFAREHADRDFVVHCEAGVSRSPAVALALYEIFNGKPPPASLEKAYSLHNRLVRRKVLDAATHAEDVT